MCYKLLTVAVLVLVLLPGCGSVYHNEGGTRALTVENVEKIVDGQTTKDEVRTIFGNPSTVTKNQFGETWMYSRSVRESNVMGWTTKMEAHGLVITFDEKGIVKTHSHSVTQPVGAGIKTESER